MTTLKTILKDATTLLNKMNIDNAALDARLLIGHILKYDRAQLITKADEEISLKNIMAIDVLIKRRASREPVARILGAREFWGLPFSLNKDTLEPRPDSETLVETALKHTVIETPKRILDLGTGTGCLLLALLSEWKSATGLGVDQSQKAIEQAIKNAKSLDLDDRANFQTGDWLNDITEKFDLIISNPPYITDKEMTELQPEVSLFDPSKALAGGKDGLTPYRHLIPLLPDYLNKHGFIIFEVGAGQANDVALLMKENSFKDIQITKDLNDIERCIYGII